MFFKTKLIKIELKGSKELKKNGALVNQTESILEIIVDTQP